MKHLTKMLVLVTVLLMILSMGVYGETTEATTTAMPQDSPSFWAMWEVQMAYSSGLGQDTNYVGYTAPATAAGFLQMEQSLESKFEVKDATPVSVKEMTRGAVLTELYDILSLTMPEAKATTSLDDITEFFVTNHIMMGRSNGDYALNKVCSNEEMIVLCERVYNVIVYSLDMDSKGAYWKVSDGDNTVYLLGSIHVTDNNVFPLSKEILTGFYSSDALVVEANTMIMSQEDTAYIQSLMFLSGDQTIDQLISKETYDSYKAKMESFGVAPDMYNKIKPWAAALTIQNIEMAQENYSAYMGIDLYFMYQANGQIPILEVEGAKYQIELFNSMSAELAEGYLQSILSSEGGESTDTLSSMMNDWRKGDMESLGKTVFVTENQTDIEKEFNDMLLGARNEHMVEYVKELLADAGHDYFFVVGAAHMLGDKGIVSEIEKAGYTVERVK